MGHWLARARREQDSGFITRFDPAYWTVNFPRPTMASVVTQGYDALRVDAVFYNRADLVGLIWDAEDHWSHPLLTYETARDFRGMRLAFRWRSGGVIPLDGINGPTLTIEGRDPAGNPRGWFVRLWNYASGSPTDAQVTFDFDALAGGFYLPDDADPVWAGDVDRIFISLVAPDYAQASTEPLDAPVEGWAELTDMVATGPGAVLAVGDVAVPEHGLRIANGYDDTYNLTPERLLRQVLRLGYRDTILHYVGMSHYFRLAWNDDEARWVAGAGGINVACAAWHRDFAERARALGYAVIWSLSYELLDMHMPSAWKQRAADGIAGLTGWDPPSSLMSPANAAAMQYLKDAAAAFVGIALEAELPVRFQIGEPWWWTMPDGRPCLYDAAAVAAFGGAPVAIPTLRGPLDAAQTALLDQAGALLAVSTAGLANHVRELAPAAELLLLVYLPTVLDAAAPEAKRANLPAAWAWPAFDVLQLEDYDWTAAGNVAATTRGIAAATARLGYSIDRQHFLSGFVLMPHDEGQWPAIAEAADAARARGTAETFVWALPQVLRDGFVHFDGEKDVQAFDDVSFPLALGREVEVSPAFSTAIVTGAGGHEARNASWSEARTSYEAGPGVRSERDIATLLAFFRARMGPARGFRLRDPFDSVSGDDGVAAPTDEALGIGDGSARGFPLVKDYGGRKRRITRPVAGTVRVAVDGVETAAFALDPGGIVALDVPPPAGAAVTAGFVFDVPVRFAEDSLSVNRATFLAGAAPSVPLIEVRE